MIDYRASFNDKNSALCLQQSVFVGLLIEPAAFVSIGVSGECVDIVEGVRNDAFQGGKFVLDVFEC